MNTKTKTTLVFTVLASLVLFFSCSNDEEFSKVPTNASKNTYTNQANRQSLIPHQLTIINNSRYNFAISAVNAQSNYELEDPMSIFHKPTRPLLIMAESSVTFYDYKQVSDSRCQISKWHVLNGRVEDLGDFECDAIANLYGMLSVPGNPQSLRYPVWKSIEGIPVDQANEPLAIIGVNNPNSPDSSLRLGNLVQGFSTVIKYGKVIGMGSSSTSLTTDPVYRIWLATATWKQQYVGGSSNNGNITITIENHLTR